MPDFSPSDRDMMIRTVIGEADDQPPVGQAAVAHVILNRVAKGEWGDSPSSVVLARGQFEPWQTRARELIGIKPDSTRYQKVAGVVDDVLAGNTPDPTGGMTHFLQPDIVRRRRGGSLPDWASGPGLRIGDHVFYAPEGRTATAQEPDYVSDWLPKKGRAAAAAPAPSPAAPAQAAPEEDLVGAWLPKGGAKQPAASPAPQPADPFEAVKGASAGSLTPEALQGSAILRGIPGDVLRGRGLPSGSASEKALALSAALGGGSAVAAGALPILGRGLGAVYNSPLGKGARYVAGAAAAERALEAVLPEGMKGPLLRIIEAVGHARP